MTEVDRRRLTGLLARERASYAELHPTSARHYADARHLFGHVPMTWMNKNAAGFPLYVDRARGARVCDVDGHEYLDLCPG